MSLLAICIVLLPKLYHLFSIFGELHFLASVKIPTQYLWLQQNVFNTEWHTYCASILNQPKHLQYYWHSYCQYMILSILLVVYGGYWYHISAVWGPNAFSIPRATRGSTFRVKCSSSTWMNRMLVIIVLSLFLDISVFISL